ncbi:MAG: DUF6338 family protein [Acidimicrobiaceae bacterium]|nr:DUF6338 family protein [Acidimicrobiaceae bacterium]
MPSTLLSLLVAIYVLIPGYCYYAVRRRAIPTRRVSTIVEAADVMAVAMITNTLTLIAYGIMQSVPWIREHSPSVVHLLRDPGEYLLHSNSRLAYVGVWALGLLIGSSILATAFALNAHPTKKTTKTTKAGLVQRLQKRYPARVTDASVWDRYFYSETPEDHMVYLECYLHDESYVAGTLARYNPDINDSPDRDLVQSDPLSVIKADRSQLTEPGCDQHVILPARDIKRIIVTYVNSDTIGTELERDFENETTGQNPIETKQARNLEDDLKTTDQDAILKIANNTEA